MLFARLLVFQDPLRGIVGPFRAVIRVQLLAVTVAVGLDRLDTQVQPSRGGFCSGPRTVGPAPRYRPGVSPSSRADRKTRRKKVLRKPYAGGFFAPCRVSERIVRQ